MADVEAFCAIVVFTGIGGVVVMFVVLLLVEQWRYHRRMRQCRKDEEMEA